MTYKKVCPITKEDTIRRDFFLDLPNGAVADVNLYSGDGTCMSGSIKIGNTTIYIEPSFKNNMFKQVNAMVVAFNKQDNRYIKLDKTEIGIGEVNDKLLKLLNSDDELKQELNDLNALVNKRMVVNELADIDEKLGQLNVKRTELEAKLAKME